MDPHKSQPTCDWQRRVWEYRPANPVPGFANEYFQVLHIASCVVDHTRTGGSIIQYVGESGSLFPL
jgi:hypothetical protein